MKESDILYEIGPYWVCKARKFTGYEVYKDGISHATRVARIGYPGTIGLDRAILEANRRADRDRNNELDNPYFDKA